MDTKAIAAGSVEFALMVEWDDGVEFIPAQDEAHAEAMAIRLYAHRPTWTVGREIQPWRYVRRADSVLTEEVSR